MLRCARNNPSSRVVYDPFLFASATSPFPLVSASHPSLDCAWENKRDRQVTAGQPYSNASGKPGEALRYLYWLLAAWQWSTGNSTPCPSPPLCLSFFRLRSSTFPPPLILSRLSLYPFSFTSLSPASTPSLSSPFSHSRSSNSVPLIPFDSFHFLSLQHHRVRHRRCHFRDVEYRGKPSYTTVEVIKSRADSRQLLGRKRRRFHRPSVLEERKQKRPTVPDGRYRTYCHIRIAVWRAIYRTTITSNGKLLPSY